MEELTASWKAERMNLKHGFYSNNPDINSDSTLLRNSLSLSADELVNVENYLNGGTSKDPFLSHAIVVNILLYGRYSYPTLFPLAEKYQKTEDYKTLSRMIEYFAERNEKAETKSDD